ncbi:MULTISPECIES: S9 family peptidase [unclassified Rhodanobacter]|uniref:S9 family peptidase n=1 Tax=unclassified Rhodanobacter TaxID=2621553 RepID=UPI0007AA30BC|nr:MULTISPECIES: S9 family peptidase [unclassified Rhodanobacter]KZC15284.1 peptidase S9 [Rhodanobacter sp. FW104-R8]KZC26455.1 peptidase S9 [Rhodanobacter sp. FW510-T8]KZC29460.1 peptidase S9 [Rhodanobacter sp. FW510-R10]
MKPLIAALLLALVAAPAMAGDVVDTSFVKAEGAHAFNVRDLVMMDRVSDPQLSPDGRYAAFGVRSTDYDANKGVSAVYVLDLAKDGQPVKVVDKGSSARWSADGRSLYFVAPAKGVAQLWRVDLGGEGGLNLAEHAPAVQVSHGVLDVGGYKLSPDGKQVLLSYEVYADCTTLACTQQRIDARAKDKASGTLYDKLFVRHWDTWADGRRNQLFVARFDGKGQLAGEPKRLSRGIDGDVPSKPFGDESEFGFAPDGKTVYFNARIAGTSEPWSTNFDVYSVPADGLAAPKNLTAENKAWDAYPVASPDGKTLYYLAMKTPGFEADRFAIMALDLASGAKREVDPKWDRSPGGLTISADGKTLYATADDNGQHPLFAIDAASGKVSQLVGEGTVSGFSLAAGKLLLIRDDLKRPADVYLAAADGSSLKQVTHFNAADLKNAKVGDAEFFTFKGWNNETVQGYVVKPVDYQPGKTYPVAFIIHGGPQGAMENGWSYRWNPQTYAGQGFAVVTVNFHGSTGYGQAFTDSISGDWGGKPLEDLKLGWKAALDKYRFLDGDRACALGASYGGYMVYWIAGVWNQPWKCLVDHDGVFDARAMYYDTEELWFEERENGGTQYEHPENYEKFNPLNHVKDWRVPMLVIHSAKDFRIPDTQGLGAFTALQRRGIPSQLLHFPDENHWVLKPHNSVQWHDSVNAWLKQWTAKDAPKAASR